MKKVVSLIMLSCLCATASLQAIYQPMPPAPPIPDFQAIEQTQNKNEFDHLLLAIQKYLAVQHEVSRVIWNNSQVENKLMAKRVETMNEQYAASLMEVASQFALEGWMIEHFVGALTDATVMVFQADFGKWAAEGRGKFDEVLDMHKDFAPYVVGELLPEIFYRLSKMGMEEFEKMTTSRKLPKPLSTRKYDAIDPRVWKRAIGCFRMEIQSENEMELK